MSKRKHRSPPSPPPSAAPVAPSRFGWDEVAALAAAAICIAVAWLSWPALNSDGVSYLDLARLARGGDWSGFVQGYWSPLYPVVLAALSTLTGTGAVALVVLAHVVNGLAAVAGIILLWWWGRRSERPFVTRTLLATFLLASTGLPHIELITPDVLLLALMTWIGYELVQHQGRRPVQSGLALGLAFLAKTSVWPWLLLSLPLRLWGAPDHAGRRQVAGSFAITLLVAMSWIAPLSLKSGGLTISSAGPLNYEWYIGSSDSRTPDTHSGRHRAYREVVVDSLHRVEVIEFAGVERWTYAPWSDPTAWHEGIESTNAHPPGTALLLAYWGRGANRTFGWWSALVLVCVLLPVAVSFRRPDLPPLGTRVERPTLVAALLGLGGLVQFALIHSEPRLIAPFLFLFGVAVLHPFLFAPPPAPAPATSAIGRQIATAIGWGAVIWMSRSRLRDGIVSNDHLQRSLATIQQQNPVDPSGRASAGRVAVVGPAMPVAPAAFMAGLHIVAQLPPRSLPVARSLSPERQLSLLHDLFSGKADAIWITDANGSVSRIPVPPR